MNRKLLVLLSIFCWIFSMQAQGGLFKKNDHQKLYKAIHEADKEKIINLVSKNPQLLFDHTQQGNTAKSLTPLFLSASLTESKRKDYHEIVLLVFRLMYQADKTNDKYFLHQHGSTDPSRPTDPDYMVNIATALTLQFDPSFHDFEKFRQSLLMVFSQGIQVQTDVVFAKKDPRWFTHDMVKWISILGTKFVWPVKPFIAAKNYDALKRIVPCKDTEALKAELGDDVVAGLIKLTDDFNLYAAHYSLEEALEKDLNKVYEYEKYIDLFVEKLELSDADKEEIMQAWKEKLATKFVDDVKKNIEDRDARAAREAREAREACELEQEGFGSNAAGAAARHIGRNPEGVEALIGVFLGL